MSIWNFCIDLFASSFDTVLVIATICTLFVVIVAFYLNNKQPSLSQEPLLQQTDRSAVISKSKACKRIDSGDGPRRSSGRRRRREDNTAVSVAHPAQANSPGISPACPTTVSSPEVVVDVIEIENKESSSQDRKRQPSNLVEPGYAECKPVASTEPSKQDKFSHTDSDETAAAGSKPVTYTKRPAEPKVDKPTTVQPRTEYIQPSPQSLTSSSPVANANGLVPDAADEWRNVNPKRRERQRSRVSPKPLESGMPEPCPKPEPDALSGFPEVTEVTFKAPVQAPELSASSLESDHPNRSPKRTQHTEDIALRAQNQQESEVNEEPSEPSPVALEKKPPSKASKSRRKRRSAAASKLPNVADSEPTATCVATPPQTVEAQEADIAPSPNESHRTTPDDSEFELIELSGLVSHPPEGPSINESDVDASLNADWGLAQTVPCTGDMQEFPCLPGAESQFAIVHPTDSQKSSLECSRHPQAGHLLKSALKESDDDDNSVCTVGASVNLPTVQAAAQQPTTLAAKPTVKRSKARRAD